MVRVGACLSLFNVVIFVVCFDMGDLFDMGRHAPTGVWGCLGFTIGEDGFCDCARNDRGGAQSQGEGRDTDGLAA